MIYIQKNTETGMPQGSDAALAMYGAIESEQKYKLIDINELDRIPSSAFISNIFIGTVEFMLTVFEKGNIDVPKLPRNSNRVSEIMNIEEAIDRIENDEVLFVKPTITKLFTGLVADKYCTSYLRAYDKNTEVLVYPVIDNLISEWRVYISDGKIIDSRHYLGDFKIIPDYDLVESIVKDNSDFPSTYTIDIGITSKNENFVVEFNDMWAIGNYGIENMTYLRLLKKRYIEIIKK